MKLEVAVLFVSVLSLCACSRHVVDGSDVTMPKPLTGPELHELAHRITVQILITDDRGNRTPAGSGVWLTGDGLIATCLHVIRDSSGPVLAGIPEYDNISLENGKVTKSSQVALPLSVVGSDPSLDIALLQLEPDALTKLREDSQSTMRSDFQSAKLALHLPEAGTGALLSGFSMGGPVLVGRSTGVAGIAVLPESSPGAPEIKQVRILISANSILGDSGGPVLDDFGNVIGLIQGNLTAPFMDETQRPVIYIRPARDSKGHFINDQIGKQKLEATDLYARSGIAAVIPSYFISQLVSRNATAANKKD